MSHRISIEIGNNEFLIEQADGGIYDTSIGRVYPLSAIFGAMSWELAYHQENGFSPNCVICRDEARKSALAQPAPDGEPVDNSDRIAALFAELQTCDNFARALEIDQALRGYGVEAVTEAENRRLDDWADGKMRGGRL